MITFGNTSVEISLFALFALFLILKLLPIVAFIWFVVQGFRVHWGWGVANLLIPFAIIPFCIFHPKESKRPLILTGIGLGVFLILWICARHGSSSYPKVEVSPGLSASAKYAVLHLKLDSFNWATDTGRMLYGMVSQKKPVEPGRPAGDRTDAEQLIAIKADGFVIRFTDRVGGEMQTNIILFPFGQTTETNTLEWHVVGDYSGKVASLPNAAPDSTADNTFHLLTTNGFAVPPVGSGPALDR